MKKRLFCALLAGCVLLSGCASMLERDFVSITPHNSTTTDEGTSSVLRVENYQELVNSLIYFISSGMDEGTIRLYMDSAQVDESLRAARQEVLTEYPLGAYAVEKIEYEVAPLVTYSQADVHFVYRRTQSQLSSIAPVTGISAIRSTLSSALAEFLPEQVLNITYFDGNSEFISFLIQQAYYSAPASALEYPQLEINIYPEGGTQHIVEVLFTYEQSQSQLLERQVFVEQSGIRLAQEVSVSSSPSATLQNAANAIWSSCDYSAEGGATAYHALLEGSANSEGLALTMALICQELSIPCRVARGIRNGEPHFWNVVSSDDGWRHMDLSREDPFRQGFYTDTQWLEDGYFWDQTSLPICE